MNPDHLTQSLRYVLLNAINDWYCQTGRPIEAFVVTDLLAEAMMFTGHRLFLSKEFYMQIVYEMENEWGGYYAQIHFKSLFGDRLRFSNRLFYQALHPAI